MDQMDLILTATSPTAMIIHPLQIVPAIPHPTTLPIRLLLLTKPMVPQITTEQLIVDIFHQDYN